MQVRYIHFDFFQESKKDSKADRDAGTVYVPQRSAAPCRVYALEIFVRMVSLFCLRPPPKKGRHTVIAAADV